MVGYPGDGRLSGAGHAVRAKSPICGFIDRMGNPDAGGTGMMRAVVIDRFGGPEQLYERQVPLPSPGRGQVLIRLETAGVGAGLR